MLVINNYKSSPISNTINYAFDCVKNVVCCNHTYTTDVVKINTGVSCNYQLPPPHVIVPECSSIELEKELKGNCWKKQKEILISSPQGSTGWALCDLWAGDPLGLVHYGAGMRKTSDVLNGHQHVAWALENPHSLVVGNAAEIVPIHLHDLISNL